MHCAAANAAAFCCVYRVEVKHERTRMASFGAARVHMTLDVRGDHHANEILDTLRAYYKDSSHIAVDRN